MFDLLAIPAVVNAVAVVAAAAVGDQRLQNELVYHFFLKNDLKSKFRNIFDSKMYFKFIFIKVLTITERKKFFKKNAQLISLSNHK